MNKAFKEAKKALANEEVPIGCVIVDEEGKIIARGYNEKERKEDVSAHAEIIAIRKAGNKRKNWRLNGCTMYVTLEPCSMCASAILQSRISKLYISLKEPNSGAFGSKYNILELEKQNLEVNFGLMEEETKGILVSFFKDRRKK